MLEDMDAGGSTGRSIVTKCDQAKALADLQLQLGNSWTGVTVPTHSAVAVAVNM